VGFDRWAGCGRTRWVGDKVIVRLGVLVGDDLPHDVAGGGEELVDGDVGVNADAFGAGALLAEVPLEGFFVVGDDRFVDRRFV